MYIPADPKLWENISKDNLLKKPKFWLPILGGSILVYSVPENIFLNFYFLDYFIKIIIEIIPSVEKFGGRSKFSSATLLLFSYFWIMIPYYTFIFYINKEHEIHFVEKWQKSGRRRHFLPILLISFFITIFSLYYLFALPQEASCLYFCIYESKNIQLIYSFCGTLSVSGMLTCIFWWIKNFRAIHISKMDKKEACEA